MQMDYSSCFIFFYRTFVMGSGATNFMRATSKHILSTEIFPDFIRLYSRGDKKNKNSKPLTKINSSESFTKDLVFKFLPETSPELNILQKIFQDLTQYDKLVMQLLSMSLHKFLKVHLTSIAYELFFTGRSYSKQDCAQKNDQKYCRLLRTKIVNLALRC